MLTVGISEKTHCALPGWVPDAVANYIVHTETGMSIRALARERACHASTILRQIRRCENRRDDPLVDDALRTLSQQLHRETGTSRKDRSGMQDDMGNPTQTGKDAPMGEELQAESLRILRHLCENGAVLAVARDMEKAVVVQSDGAGGQKRTAVTQREIVQSMALRDWIATSDPEARIVRYNVTTVGRAELKKALYLNGRSIVSDAEQESGGHIDAPNTDAVRINSVPTESPLYGLARRRDKDGNRFLSRELLRVAERLREDFEISDIGQGQPKDWDSFLAGSDCAPRKDAPKSVNAARERVADALKELGPGLGDVVLRCCCYLEGLETAEKTLGWAARSGKIVLRIGLQRLKRHYDDQGQFAPKIG